MNEIVYLIPLGGIAVGALFMIGVYKLTMRWLDGRQRHLGGADVVDLEQLRAEVAGALDLRDRVTELEERVDFAERLLAQRKDPDRLVPGR